MASLRYTSKAGPEFEDCGSGGRGAYSQDEGTGRGLAPHATLEVSREHAESDYRWRRDRGIGHRLPAGGAVSRRRNHGARKGERRGPAPDRPQQRRAALRAVLQARLGEGAAGGDRHPPDGGLLPGERHPARESAASWWWRPTKARWRACDGLEERGTANGLEGLRRLGREEMREIEPHVGGVAALRVPQEGIVDYARVCAALVAKLAERGARVVTSARVMRLRRGRRGLGGRNGRGRIRGGLPDQLRRATQRPRGGAGGRAARGADPAVPRRVLPDPRRSASSWCGT